MRLWTPRGVQPARLNHPTTRGGPADYTSPAGRQPPYGPPGEPARHRYNPGGNRRINRVLHLMAITQLRCEPRAQALYDNARKHGHTKKEARRILKRHLSNVIYRHMIRDLASHTAQSLLAA
jgi:transposase